MRMLTKPVLEDIAKMKLPRTLRNVAWVLLVASCINILGFAITALAFVVLGRF